MRPEVTKHTPMTPRQCLKMDKTMKGLDWNRN